MTGFVIVDGSIQDADMQDDKEDSADDEEQQNEDNE